MERFVTLQEIIEIYCISRKLVRDILRHYGIDCYKQDDTIYIDLKKFHKIYVSKYNPVLFTVEEKEEAKKEPIIKNTLNRTFFNIFSEPVNCKQNLRKLVMSYAG
jgi:hypothetical protein